MGEDDDYVGHSPDHEKNDVAAHVAITFAGAVAAAVAALTMTTTKMMGIRMPPSLLSLLLLPAVANVAEAAAAFEGLAIAVAVAAAVAVAVAVAAAVILVLVLVAAASCSSFVVLPKLLFWVAVLWSSSVSLLL